MKDRIQTILNDTQLYSDTTYYRFIKLPVNALTAAAGIMAEAHTAFSALLFDKDEISVLLDEQDYAAFQQRLAGYTVSDIRYRLITFDVVLEHDLVGFMAVISSALAEAGISILTFAAFSRDHVFVNDDDHEAALQVLENLKGR